MSQLFVWDPLVPLLVSLGPYGYPHWCMGGIHLHTYRCHMGVIGVPEVKKSIFPLWSGIALGWLKWPNNTPKRCRIRARAQTPLLARSEPINEGITAKIRPRYPQCTHGGAARVSTCSTVVSEIHIVGLFGVFLGHFDHPRAIPDQSGKSIF